MSKSCSLDLIWIKIASNRLTHSAFVSVFLMAITAYNNLTYNNLIKIFKEKKSILRVVVQLIVDCPWVFDAGKKILGISSKFSHYGSLLGFDRNYTIYQKSLGRKIGQARNSWTMSLWRPFVKCYFMKNAAAKIDDFNLFSFKMFRKKIWSVIDSLEVFHKMNEWDWKAG